MIHALTPRSIATSFVVFSMLFASACSGPATPEADETASAKAPMEAPSENAVAGESSPFDLPHSGDIFDAGRLGKHVQVLSSDEFEGRAPSSEGERKTTAYLSEQFAAAGLSPGNGDSFLQPVPVVEITTQPDTQMTITHADGASRSLKYGEDMMVWTKRVVEQEQLDNSELVFVGYGIVAPEYDWNDYDGIDMRGKTAVILVNDPGFATGDGSLFRGKAMTYYGRWTYKYEEAARQGAAGAIVIHETAPAAYPWAVVSGGWSGPQFDLVSQDNNMSRTQVEAWISAEAATELFEAAGFGLEEAHKFALTRDVYAPRPLNQTASVALTNTVRRSTTNNVVGVLEGSTHPQETIIYMAHWDHMGKDTSLEGDQIYNGAIDNATGTAALVELAYAFGKLAQPPQRSILFLATTAEESGLLGSKHYGTNPLRPLATTVGAINMDGLNVHGRTHDISVIGYGSSEMEKYLVSGADKQNRVVKPEPTPEKGFFYRSDHFNLAKVGVPVLYAKSGIDYVDYDAAWGQERAREYTSLRYHKPADEYDPDWDLSGALQDVTLYYQIGLKLSQQRYYPRWNDGTEFKAIREASRAARAN